MKAADVKAALSEFEQKTGLPTDKCQTGQSYRSFLLGAASEEAALEGLRTYLLDYAAEQVGILYWRTEPRVTHDDDGYRAFARLIITDQPAIYADVEALQSAKTFGAPLLPRVT